MSKHDGKPKHKKGLNWKQKGARICLSLAGFLIAVAAIGNLLPKPAHAAETPPAGYNTWYQFGANVNENSIILQGKDMVSAGLVKSGYDIITVDDGWQGVQSATRNPAQPLTWNVNEFPHGMPWLARQLGAMGIQLGIYTAIGRNTCTAHGALAGSYGHYAQDAATFKSWGVKFVKVDSCAGLPTGTTATQLTAYFKQFGSYITSGGMVYSHELPVLMTVGSPQWLAAVKASSTFSTMWRVAPDESPLNSAGYTIASHLEDDLHLAGVAGPGHWNDLDMLVPGKPAAHLFGWNLAQEQSQMAVWAMEASPLFISTDVAGLTPAELASLENPHFLAIDNSGAQASHGLLKGNVQMLAKPADGGTAVLFSNVGTGTTSTTFTLAQLGLTVARVSDYNVWTGKTGTIGGITTTIGAGQSLLLVLKPA
jgi:alpha-galactosidase